MGAVFRRDFLTIQKAFQIFTHGKWKIGLSWKKKKKKKTVSTLKIGRQEPFAFWVWKLPFGVVFENGASWVEEPLLYIK